MSDYIPYDKRVEHHVAALMPSCRRIAFHLYVDVTACFMVIDDRGIAWYEHIAYEVVDTFRFNPEGMAQRLCRLIRNQQAA